MSTEPLAVGVDIGGTKVVAGLVDTAGRITQTRRRSTPGRDVVAVEDTITEVVSELLEAAGDREVSGIGVGAAGFVDSDRELVMFSPHLAWRREPLRKALADRLSRDVLIDNDANGAAWAEWRFGAGRGEPRLVCITLGTGIGGGLVVDGRLERGRFGMAGEFGHMVLVPGGLRCECGNRGCWEQYASGNALGREGRELAEGGLAGRHGAARPGRRRPVRGDRVRRHAGGARRRPRVGGDRPRGGGVARARGGEPRRRARPRDGRGRRRRQRGG